MNSQFNELVNRLESTFGGNLVSVIVFGSAVAEPGDAIKTDYQIMIVAKSLSADDLRLIRPAITWWSRQGFANPVLFTLEEFNDSLDVFPVEFRHMKQAYQVIYGRDILAASEISKTNLRWQTEHELRGKMIRLRSLYPSAAATTNSLTHLMTESIVSFVRLMRPLLELAGEEPPIGRLATVHKTGEKFGINASPLERILRLREEPVDLLEVEAQDLFTSYLNVLTHVIEAVDKM